MIAKCKKNSKY